MSDFTMPNFSGVEKGSKEYNEVISKRNTVKKNAKELILKTILENKESFDANVISAAECLLTKRAGGGRGHSKLNQIMNLFDKVGNGIDEDAIFAELKLGRLEMKNYIRDTIKKTEPSERKWIAFDPEQGEYTLMGIGEKVPKDWTGYKPVTVEDIESADNEDDLIEDNVEDSDEDDIEDNGDDE